MEDKLSKCLTSFRKSQGTQLLLVTMIEKWEKAVDKRECVSILFLISQIPLNQSIMTFYQQN